MRRDLPGLQYDEDAGKASEVLVWHGTRQFGCLTIRWNGPFDFASLHSGPLSSTVSS